MPVKPKYCSQCGGTVETRLIEDRERTVCPGCGTIFYENPLPVAAAVVLNEQREVLLVRRKREPHKGAWCLPMGFAELGETIGEAARRELREETGITARIVRLLDADSFESEHYGDLLIVTFEMQKVSGEERPGDDAEEVRYFPIEDHPRLAFRSNETALRVCAAGHLEAWAIQDSFLTLQEDASGRMLSDALVTLIEQRADEISRLWLADVRSNPTTLSYRRVDAAQLRERATTAISQFGRWLKGDEAADEVTAFYWTLGRDRGAAGFKVHEVLSSLTLLKKRIWDFVRSQDVWEQPIDVYRVLELSRRVAAFFDKAMYHTVRGFEDQEQERRPDTAQ